jgi:hypothetical protein
MSQPITVDIPHKLGRAGAHARLENGIGKLAGLFPGGGAVQHRWEGDTMHLTVSAMGQTVTGTLDALEDHVHAVLDLPPFLALFANKIREKLSQDGPKLLE